MNNVIPQIVKDVLAKYGAYVASPQSLKGTMSPVSDLASRYKVGVDTISGILRGRYDNVAGINRTQKKQVRIVRNKRAHDVMLYDSKGYAPSGKSIKGAVEMSDDGLYLKCHECGEWFANLSHHVLNDHGTPAKEYKLKHGLKQATSLLNEPMRIKAAVAGQRRWATFSPKAKKEYRERMMEMRHAAKGKPAPKKTTAMLLNARGKCAVQSLHDLRLLCDRLGRSPSQREVQKNGINHNTLIKTYGSLRAAVALCGRYAPPPTTGRAKWYSDKELIALLKEFGKTHLRQPFQSDCKRGLLPSYVTFFRRFGSWQKALRKAGYKPVKQGDRWAADHKKNVATVLNAKPQAVNGYYV